MKEQSTVVIFIDDDPVPAAALPAPVRFTLDTRKLPDGMHRLRIVSKDPDGKEGLRIIPFEVRNGPAVAVEGIRENDVVDGLVPLMINAYGKGDQKLFVITGSETPQSVPFWIFILLISFVAWACYYMITSVTMPLQ